MLNELGQNLKKSHTEQDEQMKELTKECDSINQQTDRLYEAVEKGVLPLDNTLQERVQ